MKLMVFLALCLTFTSSFASRIVFTPGDPQSAILAKNLLPEWKNERKPGGEGILLWNAFLEEKKSLSIQLVANTHILDLSKNFNSLSKANLLSVLTLSNIYIFSHNDSRIKNLEDLKLKNHTIGAININGVCALIIKKLIAEKNANLTLVSYKTPQQGLLDFQGKHTDLFCTVGTTAQTLLNDPNINMVSNLTKKYGFKTTQYLFSNKDMEEQEQDNIMSSIKNNINQDIKNTLDNNGIKLLLLTGKDATNYYKEQEVLFKSLYQYIEKE